MCGNYGWYWGSRRERTSRTIEQQLDLNYDLNGTSALEIEELLPAEFEEWRATP